MRAVFFHGGHVNCRDNDAAVRDEHLKKAYVRKPVFSQIWG